MEKCNSHSDQWSAVRCEQCRRPFCAECLLVVGQAEKPVCKVCHEHLIKQLTQARKIRNWLLPLSLLLAGISVYTIAQNRENTALVVCSAIALVIVLRVMRRVLLNAKLMTELQKTKPYPR